MNWVQKQPVVSTVVRWWQRWDRPRSNHSIHNSQSFPHVRSSLWPRKPAIQSQPDCTHANHADFMLAWWRRPCSCPFTMTKWSHRVLRSLCRSRWLVEPDIFGPLFWERLPLFWSFGRVDWRSGTWHSCTWLFISQKTHLPYSRAALDSRRGCLWLYDVSRLIGC